VALVEDNTDNFVAATPGTIVLSIFMMVMIGGGIIFIDDKARGLHEGYLVTFSTVTIALATLLCRRTL
jgi:hypothetical protein